MDDKESTQSSPRPPEESKSSPKKSISESKDPVWVVRNKSSQGVNAILADGAGLSLGSKKSRDILESQVSSHLKRMERLNLVEIFPKKLN